MLKYDAEKFISDWQSVRMRDIVRDCLTHEDWFDYNQLLEDSVERARIAYQKLSPKSKGHPSDSRYAIKRLIKIGFLLADPVRGLKVNPDFIPTNQQPRSYLGDV